ncbi:preprotein translocase subunit SecE [Candidatus Parcubacteria bacterium]|nr:MAG: preprotein translocase subunit SecE [Candidatus Parcubacteria bacterium]
MSKLTNYIKETKVELKSVNWPTKKQALNYTLLVIGASVAVAAFLGVFDMLFAYLLGKFII